MISIIRQNCFKGDVGGLEEDELESEIGRVMVKWEGEGRICLQQLTSHRASNAHEVPWVAGWENHPLVRTNEGECYKHFCDV